LSMANQLNIDVAEAIECKMAKNEKKYPVSRG
jgi:NTP pyrophosphatase (non-canonical NTP hydrolase)